MDGIEFWKGIALIEGDTHFTKWVKEHGSLLHDVATHNALDKLIKDGDTVLDVGAHIGTMSAWFSNKVGFDGTVRSFEPNPKAFYCLRHNVGGMKNMILHNLGVGEKKGQMSLAVNIQNNGASHLRKGTGTPVITIDSLNIQHVDFVKIDCEGMDYAVLLGMQKTIEKCRPIIMVEIVESHLKRNGNNFEQVKSFFNTFGYAIRNLYPSHPMVGVQFDIVAIPNEKLNDYGENNSITKS